MDGLILLELGELLGGSFSLSSKEEELQINPETGFLEKVIIDLLTFVIVGFPLIAFGFMDLFVDLFIVSKYELF